MTKLVRRLRIFGITFILTALLVVVVAYAMGVPYLLAAEYGRRIDSSRTGVELTFKKLSKTPETDVFSEYDTSLVARQDELSQINGTIDNAVAELTTFAKEVDSLPGIVFASLVNTEYQKAIISQDKMLQNISESRDVLRDYRQLVIYLQTVTKAQQVFEAETAKVNKVENFDVLEGRGAEMRESALKVRATMGSLQKQKPSFDFKAPHLDMVRSFTLATEGLEQLAAGLDRAVDSEIYDGVGKIERAVDGYDPGFKNALFDAMGATLVLEEVVNLPDKLEAFKA